jgi:ribosomal protein L16 Arg81 hydroxylase
MNIKEKISSAIGYQYDFEQLINPITLDEFVNRYWEKEELVVKRNNLTFYEDILTLDLVDRVIAMHRQDGDNFRVAKHSKLVPQEQYLNADGSYNLSKLYACYADGNSMVMRRIEQVWFPIGELCHKLRQTFSHHVQANMYLTPPNAVAYLPHTDAHDVMIFQINGTKHWTLYDSIFETPLNFSYQPKLDKDKLPNPRVVKMEAGDFMYIPRGIPHHAFTEDESSLHLTFGVYPVQVIDFLTKSIHMLTSQNKSLRQGLPFGYLNDDNSLQDVMSNVDWKNIIEQMNSESTLSQMQDVLENGLGLEQPMLPNSHFKSMDAISTISLKTKFKKQEFTFCKVQHVAPYCRIMYNGNSIKGLIRVASVFDFVRDNDGIFLLQDLPIANDAHKIKLAARMVRGGLLKIVE